MSSKFKGQSAVKLCDGLEVGKWTSTELTLYFLSEIDRLNPQVNAVPFVYRESALKQAEESDQRHSSGNRLGRLDGLPMTLKDAIRAKDMLSTYGLWPLRHHVPKIDSKLVAALRSAGVVFLGRSAVPTGAFDWNCRNQVYAECVNPFDYTRTPGGSSGGAAAALAAGMTPLELGSDLGGSIRYPAHCCGIYGLKTTDGLLPIDDVGPEGFRAAFKQMVSYGPMSAHLEDLSLIMDCFSERLEISDGTECLTEENLNIAFSIDLMGMPADASTSEIFQKYLQVLKDKGHIVTLAGPAVDFEMLYRDWGIIAGYEYTNVLPSFLRNNVTKKLLAWWLLDRRLGKGPFTKFFKSGIFSTELKYQQACMRRLDTYKTLKEFFAKYAVWILPAAPSVAFPLANSGKSFMTENGIVPYSKYVGSYVVPTTALGTPVLSLPIGYDESGLPVGAQIFGPRFSDRWLLKAGAKLCI